MAFCYPGGERGFKESEGYLCHPLNRETKKKEIEREK